MTGQGARIPSSGLDRGQQLAEPFALRLGRVQELLQAVELTSQGPCFDLAQEIDQVPRRSAPGRGCGIVQPAVDRRRSFEADGRELDVGFGRASRNGTECQGRQGRDRKLEVALQGW